MKRHLSILACLFTLVSCFVEPVEIEKEILVPMTISADVSDPGTKAWLNGVEVLWGADDRIAVYDGTAIREFVLTSGAGTKRANFSGEVAQSAESFTAVYPYSAAQLDGDELVATIPSRQTIGDYSVDENALVMSASAQKGASFNFHNHTSLMRFTVPAGVSEVIVASAGHETVYVTLPGTAGTFEAAVTPGSFEGLSALLKSGDSWYVKSSDKTTEIERNKIYALGELPLTDLALPISNGAEMKAFLQSSSGSTVLTAVLLEDIDMKAAGKVTASDFSGTFEGLGHRIVNIAAPLFSSSHASVRNLVLEGSISLTALVSAPLVLENHGDISSVTNRVSVSSSSSSALSSAIVLGGIAAYSYGQINGCSNEGAISFTGLGSIKAAAIGGIAGYSESPVSACRNAGKLSLRAPYGSAVSALGKISQSAVNMGGILGAAFTDAPVDDCVNDGEVVMNLHSINQGSAAYTRCQVAGIAGSPYGDITNCINHGNITAKAITSDRSLATLSYILDIGGISGGSYCQELVYNKPNDKTSIIDCTNDGDIVVEHDSANSFSPVGGIVGWPGGEAAGVKNKTIRCVNSGNITCSGAGKMRLGGIMGGTGSLEQCSNSGTVKLLSGSTDSQLGGICAFHSQDHVLSACTNTGDVISKVAASGVGGIIGVYGNVSQSSSAGCSVECLVENAAADRSSIGIIVGRFSGDAKSITIGTDAEPVIVAGTLVCGANSYPVDGLTYDFLLCGTSYYSTLHVFHVVCNVSPSSSTLCANGYVKYSDGTPAAGVSVSDGFTVAVTNAEGYYKMLASPDARYIYVSYPADAVITKNSAGTPNFFVKYNQSANRYDFSFARQSVENEFMVFAMADPQAHYAKRSPQTIADTDRFRGEAVPAINSQIAEQSLNCYGITLGDIVYSENNRNSNSGMSTMRTHFNEVNMPVFQTMGNHDFTFFNASNPLTTSATASTLYLAAQRKFEDNFGPINYSFNRGNVHFVCMRNIIFDSTTVNSDYHGGFTDEQFAWLQQDLANVPKTKMVVICVHIPFVGILNYEHVKDVLNLMKQYAAAKVFSGHTHYKRYYSNLNTTGVSEHIHSAVCGQWWWSNIEGDGCPNGYTIYKFSGTSISDEYFVGQNTHMNTRDYQMRVYRGNLKTGGSYAYFQWPHSASKLMINVFNGDSRWTVKVYENGTYSGTAAFMANKKVTYDSVKAGQTYTVPEASNQDWWAIGYNIGVKGRGTSGTSYYTNMFHMFTYTLKDPEASVKVVATDPYGNSYECTEVVSTDCWYPDYVKLGNVN